MTSWFWDELDRWGSSTALCDEQGQEIGYRDLASLADEFGRKIGAQRQLVALDAANNIPSVIALIACLRARHPVILTSEATKSRIVKTFRPNVLIDSAGNIARHSDQAHDLHDDLGVLLSTSGSTGATRLVRLSRDALHANAASIAEYLGLGPGEVPITTLPVSYSYGLSVLTSHLLSGARIVLTGRSVIDEAFWALFDREAATSLAGVPYTYELLETSGFRSRKLPSLRTMTQAGGRIDPDLRKTFGKWAADKDVRFFVMYGQTEATARIAYLPPDLQEQYGDCIGVAIPGGELRLEDEHGEPVPAGKIGELVYSGPNVMMGYATCAADLALGRTTGALRTGDLAQMAGPGIYRIVGRLSRFSKIAGLRIGLDEIEALLASHDIPGIVAGDDALIAICLEDEAHCPAAERLLDEQTSIPVRSRVVLAMSDIPRLSSGKPDYPAILKAAHSIREVEDANPQASASGLTAAYARAMNRKDVKPSDSFASLGGDSLAYIEASMAVERALGYLPDHWEQLSIARIEELAPAPSAPGARRLVTVESEMLVRPVAMTTIVTGHAITSVDPSILGGPEVWRGGALALLLTAGYNACRFQKGLFLSNERLRVIFNYVKRIVAPYYLVILAKIITPIKSGYLPWATFILIGNYYYDPEALPNRRYWFIETLFQCLLITTIIFSIPIIRKWSKEKGFSFGVGLFAAFFGTKLAVDVIMPETLQHALSHRADAWAYAFAIGWAVAEARNRLQRLACVALAIASSGIDWGLIDLHTAYLGAAAALILFIPKVKLPRTLADVSRFWAQSTFFIYLSHGVVSLMILKHFPALGVISIVAASTVAGGIFYLAWRQVERISGALFRNLAPGEGMATLSGRVALRRP